MSGQLRQKLTRPSIWLRLIYMIVLAIAFNIAEIVLFAIAVFQFFSTLFTRNPSAQLARFGLNLGKYIQQIIAYLTFASEEKPFPFSAWPDAEHVAGQESFAGASTIEAEVVSETKSESKTRKPAPKKSTSTRKRRTPPKKED